MASTIPVSLSRAVARHSWVSRSVILALLAVFILFPAYWMIVTAVAPSRDVISSTPSIIPNPATISLENFFRVFEIRPLHLWLINSATVALATTLIVVVLSLMAGYGLSRARGRLGAVVGLSLFGIRLIPITLLVVPFFIMFTSMGLRNTLLSLVIANTVVLLPFASWLMKAVFDGVPVELEEAACVDGASKFRAFLAVVLPIARPGIGATGIFAGISAWSDFAFARTLVQGETNATITVGLVGFIGEYTVDWGALMAAGLISVLPMIILFVLLEPLLVSGLTQGAVK